MTVTWLDVHRCPQREERTLTEDDRGAIMTIGVFMAIVLVGLLWYIAGIGSTLFHRERLQDAADAVALSTAIGHARGMNIIAFINIVMAALVAVVLALKVIEMMLTGLALILAGIAWFFPPAAAAIPVVNSARSVVAEIHNATRQIVDQVLVVLHLSEEAVKIITPAASTGLAMTTVLDKYNDVASFTIAIPPRIDLPVEDDVYDRLCQEAEKMLRDLVRLATDKVPLIGKVIDMAMGALIESVSAYFCYREGASPTQDIEIDRTYPFNETGAECEQNRTNFNANSQACVDWDQQIHDRRPNRAGACTNQTCTDNLARARVECNPSTARADSYSWSEATVQEEVVYDPATNSWKTTAFEYLENPEPRLVNVIPRSDAETDMANTAAVDATNLVGAEDTIQDPERGRPCDNGGIDNNRYQYPEETLVRLWSDWNTVTEVRSAPAHELPVCSKRREGLQALPPLPEAAPPPRGFNVGPHVIQYRAVRQIYGCTKKATVTMQFPEDWQAARTGDGSDKAPQKMEEGVELGDGNFQMRGFAMADGRPTRAERMLNISAFRGDTTPEAWVEPARALGNFSVAQAEYYYDHDGTEKREAWLWNMKWRARLVRFSLPSSEEGGQTQQASTSQSSGSNSFGLKLPELDFNAVQSRLPGNAPSLNVISDLVVH